MFLAHVSQTQETQQISLSGTCQKHPKPMCQKVRILMCQKPTRRLCQKLGQVGGSR